MRRPLVWVMDGPWTTTNQALDLMRGEGFYAGKRAAWEGMRRGVSHPPSYQFNDTAQCCVECVVRTVCEVSEAEWMERREPRDEPEELVLVVTAYHPDARVDPDAAAIVSKWILDGLNKARVITSEKQIVGVFHRTLTAKEPTIEFSLQEPGEFWP